MKKRLLGLIVGLSLIASPVMASGYATVDVLGNKDVTVGDTVEVNLVIDNVYDTYKDSGVEGIGGYLSFDSEYLSIVDYEFGSSPLDVRINKNINKFAGIDYTLRNGIKENTKVMTVKFKAIKEGNTEVSLKDLILTDSDDYIDAKVNGLKLNISKIEEKVETNEVEEAPVVTTTTKKATTTQTKQNVKKVEVLEEKEETTTKATTETTTVAVETEEINDKKENNTKTKNVFKQIINFIKNLFRR